jgi:uncharacterized protein YjbJ (UPF0337 family)
MSGKDKARNKAKEVKGKAKEKVGKAIGDRPMEVEGKAQQSGADLKQAGEKVKDAIPEPDKKD